MNKWNNKSLSFSLSQINKKNLIWLVIKNAKKKQGKKKKITEECYLYNVISITSLGESNVQGLDSSSK